MGHAFKSCVHFCHVLF